MSLELHCERRISEYLDALGTDIVLNPGLMKESKKQRKIIEKEFSTFETRKGEVNGTDVFSGIEVTPEIS